MYWVLRYHIWIWMLEVFAIANSFSIWNIIQSNDNDSEMSKVNISIIFPHVLEQGGNSLISGFHIQSIYWNDRFNCYFAQTKFARNVYLLKVSNQSINTDVQEVVQEGIDKCFSILTIWLFRYYVLCWYIQMFVFYEVQNKDLFDQSVSFNIVSRIFENINNNCETIWSLLRHFYKFL